MTATPETTFADLTGLLQGAGLVPRNVKPVIPEPDEAVLYDLAVGPDELRALVRATDPDWHWHSPVILYGEERDPLIREHFGMRRDFPSCPARYSDFCARLVAKGLADMVERQYEALVLFDAGDEYQDLRAMLSDTEGTLRDMAYGDDDETAEALGEQMEAFEYRFNGGR